MTHKVYVVTDLGPGDGGKGGVVHKIVTKMRAHTVIKRGGAQGSHGVHTSRNETFAFSQWGCGTFELVPTHLSEQMIVSPHGLLNEAAALRYEQDIYDPFRLLTADERAVCTTPFHGIASRLRELARRDSPRGTIGTGVGEAYRNHQLRSELTITTGDLKQPGLRDRLAAIRADIQSRLRPVTDGAFLSADREERDRLASLLYDDGFLNHVAERFAEAARQLHIVDASYLGSVILRQAGIAVVESSHGVLTDRLTGFHPHTTAIRTLPRFTHDMLARSGYDGQVVNIGVTRAYAVRHGAGPVPTADTVFTNRLLPDNAADNNRYQGAVRAGPLDFVALRYAIAVCGGPAAFDGLAVTCLDQIRADGAWHFCEQYLGATDPQFFAPDGAIRIGSGVGNQAQLEYQAALSRKLLDCTPAITTVPLDKAISNDELYDICAALLKAQTAVPVRMASFGPNETDKICR